MMTIGIDIGGKQHVVARCREGRAKADTRSCASARAGPASTPSMPCWRDRMSRSSW